MRIKFKIFTYSTIRKFYLNSCLKTAMLVMIVWKWRDETAFAFLAVPLAYRKSNNFQGLWLVHQQLHLIGPSANLQCLKTYQMTLLIHSVLCDYKLIKLYDLSLPCKYFCHLFQQKLVRIISFACILCCFLEITPSTRKGSCNRQFIVIIQAVQELFLLMLLYLLK